MKSLFVMEKYSVFNISLDWAAFLQKGLKNDFLIP